MFWSRVLLTFIMPLLVSCTGSFRAFDGIPLGGAQSLDSSLSGAKKPMMWGMNGHVLGGVNGGPYADVNQQMRLLASLGIKHYRTDFYGPAEDQYAVMQKLLDAAKPYGIVVTPILLGRLNTDVDATANYNSTFNFAKAWAQKFPQIQVFELANESNEFVRDPFTDGSTPGDWTSQPNYASTKAMIQGLLDGLRAGNPRALGAFGDAGGCNYGFMQALWNDGLRWDITVFHPYDFWGTLEDRAAYSKSTHCKGGDNIIQKHADFGKPIWLTEFNYTPGVNANNKKSVGDGVVGMMKEISALHLKYNIEVADIYELFDEPTRQGAEAQFGIFTATGETTEASTAIGNFIKTTLSSVLYP